MTGPVSGASCPPPAHAAHAQRARAHRRLPSPASSASTDAHGKLLYPLEMYNTRDM